MCGYLSEEGMRAYKKTLDDLFIRDTEIRLFDMDENEKIQKHLDKLDRIAELEDNWDLYKAVPIYKEVIQLAKEILPKLNHQFELEIFPLSYGYIQFEFEKYNGDYLEFELTDVNKIEIFIKYRNGKEEYSTCEVDVDLLNKILEEFYS